MNLGRFHTGPNRNRTGPIPTGLINHVRGTAVEMGRIRIVRSSGDKAADALAVVLQRIHIGLCQWLMRWFSYLFMFSQMSCHRSWPEAMQCNVRILSTCNCKLQATNHFSENYQGVGEKLVNIIHLWRNIIQIQCSLIILLLSLMQSEYCKYFTRKCDGTHQ